MLATTRPSHGPRASWVWAAACAVLLVTAGCERAEKSPAPAVSASTAPPPPVLQPASHLLEVGEQAPAFRLLAHTGMAVSPGRFSEKPVVVFFCPSLGTPNCVAPLQSLRDGWLGLRSKLGMVIAVLTDDRIHLREHAYAQELPFLLTTDADGAVARAYGVGIAGSAPAQLFLLSPEMKITHRVTDPGPAIATDLLKALPQ